MIFLCRYDSPAARKAQDGREDVMAYLYRLVMKTIKRMLPIKRILAGLSLLVIGMAAGFSANAQNTPLVNTSASTHVLLRSVDMGDVQWTRGFWADRFAT